MNEVVNNKVQKAPKLEWIEPTFEVLMDPGKFTSISEFNSGLEQFGPS